MSTASGTCLCGAVAFTARLPSIWVAHCHCPRGRPPPGAASSTGGGRAADAAAIDDASGTLRWFGQAPGGERGFCSRCGSPMFFRSGQWPGELHIARALFTTPVDREPQVHAYHDTHVPWVRLADDLPTKPDPAAGAA